MTLEIRFSRCGIELGGKRIYRRRYWKVEIWKTTSISSDWQFFEADRLVWGTGNTILLYCLGRSYHGLLVTR
jgi:hypothetical protein